MLKKRCAFILIVLSLAISPTLASAEGGRIELGAGSQYLDRKVLKNNGTPVSGGDYGVLPGIIASYSKAFDNKIWLRGGVDLAIGDLKESDGHRRHSVYLTDISLHLGRPFDVSSGIMITPYSGFGVNNYHAEYLPTVTENETDYYVPLGVLIKLTTKDDSYGIDIRYDYAFYRDINVTGEEHEGHNSQFSGDYNFSVAMFYEYNLDGYSIGVKPYYMRQYRYSNSYSKSNQLVDTNIVGAKLYVAF